MIKAITRRKFGQAAGAVGLALGVGATAPRILRAQEGRVVVIGGGPGGATVARYVAKDSNGALAVTLIEANPQHTTCFYSNIYLGGYRDFDSITHGYDRLRDEHGIEVVTDTAVEVDPVARKVTLAGGDVVEYDKLVIAPGIEFGGKVDAVDAAAMTVTADGESHKAAVANVIPAQMAGRIAQQAGLVDESGWCPIVPASMRSRLNENIYVVGDACVPGDMPKSAFSANSQAKVCAMAVRAELTGAQTFPRATATPAGAGSRPTTRSRSAPPTSRPRRRSRPSRGS